MLIRSLRTSSSSSWTATGGKLLFLSYWYLVNEMSKRRHVVSMRSVDEFCRRDDESRWLMIREQMARSSDYVSRISPPASIKANNFFRLFFMPVRPAPLLKKSSCIEEEGFGKSQSSARANSKFE